MKKYTVLFLCVILVFSIVGTVGASTPGPTGEYRSYFWVQNLGTEVAQVSISLYDGTGAVAYTTSTTIGVNGTLSVYVPDYSSLATGQYSAVISSSQKVAAVSNFGDIDSTASYSGFDQGSTNWYAPGIYDNYYSYYSNIYVQNVSSSPVDITLQIFAPGSSIAVYTNVKSAVPAYASVVWDQEGLAELSNNVPYAAKVSATGAVVAVTNIYGSGGTLAQLYSYNAFPAGGKSWYTPVLLKHYFGWEASLIVQNVTDNLASVTINYNTGGSDTYPIEAHSVLSIYLPHITHLPEGSQGLFSANIISDQDIVVTVNQSNIYDDAATYNGTMGGGTVVNLPHLVRKLSNYNSSVTCQNVGVASTDLAISFYSGGSLVTTTNYPGLAIGATTIFYLPLIPGLPDGFDGSAKVVSSGSNISCIGNISVDVSPIDNVDTFTSYLGLFE